MKTRKAVLYSSKMRSLIVSCAFAFGSMAFGDMAFAAENPNLMEITVKSSIESTLAYHHQLKGIQESRQAAVHGIQRAEAGFFPSIDIVANTGVGNSADPSRRARYDTLSSGNGYDAAATEVVLIQPLWDGLATYHRVKAAEIQQTSLDSRVIDVATTLALDAAIVHANVLLKRELLGYAHENVEQHLAILTDQKILTDDGASTIANVYQIEGRLARARAQLVDAQGALLEAEEDYLRITGTPSPPTLENISMPASDVMFKDAQACYETAQQSNPKILAFLSDSKHALQLKELSKSAYHPTINVEISSGAEHKGDNYSDAMLVLRWNIFNGGADAASNRIAAAEYRESRQEAFDIADTIRQESYNTWTRYTSALGQASFYLKAMAFNKQTTESFLEQFLIGERGLLDVLDSYSEHYNSSTQWATVHTNAYISAYTMFALAGTMLEQFDIHASDILVAP